MATSDGAKWLELEERCRTINQQIREMKEFAAEHDLVLVDKGGKEDVFLKALGRGMRLDVDMSKYSMTRNPEDIIDLPPKEVWQDSTGCSEQGSTWIGDLLYNGDKVLSAPGTVKADIQGWQESATHWDY